MASAGLSRLVEPMRNMYKFIIPLFALAFLLVSCGKPSTEPTADPSNPSPAPSMSALESARKSFDGTLLSGKHVIVMKTSMGDITVELDADAAPKTVTNFVMLAKAGYYDGLNFHRVIPGFMIQAGDPNGDGSGGESIFGETFEDEINAASYGLDTKTLREQAGSEPLPPQFENMTIKEFYENQGYVFSSDLQSLPLTKGAIAMANRGPATNGSQFFIVQTEAVPWLDARHTVFGRVTEGMEIVDKIAQTPRDAGDKPTEPITYTIEVQE